MDLDSLERSIGNLPWELKIDIERLIAEARAFRRANRELHLQMAASVAGGMSGVQGPSWTLTPGGTMCGPQVPGWLQNAKDVAGRAREIAREIMQQHDEETP